MLEVKKQGNRLKQGILNEGWKKKLREKNIRQREKSVTGTKNQKEEKVKRKMKGKVIDGEEIMEVLTL